MKVSTYFILVSLFCLISCKGDKVQRPEPIKTASKTEVTETNPVKKERRASRKDAPSATQVASWRAQALSILNHRLKEFSETYAIVEAGVWEYEFVYNGEMSKPGEYAGVWLDFKRDHTYDYGNNSKVLGSGKYNFHLDRGEILMVDNDGSKKPQEWRVKHADDIMIMMGSSTYRDNHLQQKLNRKADSIRE